MKKLTDSARYRDFITKRDQALEKILLNAQRKQTDIMRELLIFAKHRIRYGVEAFKAGRYIDEIVKYLKQDLESGFRQMIHPLTHLWEETRANAYTLSLVGQAEAIARATGKGQYQVDDKKINEFTSKDTMAGGKIESRVAMYLERLKSEIVDTTWQVLLSSNNEFSPEEILSIIVKKSFPAESVQKNPPKKLRRPMKEAAGDKATKDFAMGFVSDRRWDSIVEEYLDQYELKNRSPNDFVSAADDEEAIYKWDLERDLTEELVASVRAGEIDGAEGSPVQDFLWVAVIDNKTDECCTWRDGLTTQEIENELNGSHSDDICQSSVPPAHFNCRCRLVPVVQELPDRVSSEKELKDFDEWLAS